MPDDTRWMRHALRLAEKSYAVPNPMVGCVLVKQGRVVGEGFTSLVGGAHAEVNALRMAGAAAKGATAYVTLEPCSHFGRTPPCAMALVEAEVAEVVVATTDTNPQVSGQGIEALVSAGIGVRTGVLEQEARRANEAFFYYQERHLPFITIKTATSLDGKTATRNGDSRWITSEKARQYVHKQRAKSDAVLTGIGTVLADDPELTARFNGVPRQPLRIVVDSQLRIPLDSKLLRSAGNPPVLVVGADPCDPYRVEAIKQTGVELMTLPAESGKVNLTALVEALGNRGVTSLFIEGGGRLNAAFVSAGLCNRLLWFMAPKLVGGADAPTGLEGVGIEWMRDARPVQFTGFRRFGPDILLEARLDDTIDNGSTRESENS